MISNTLLQTSSQAKRRGQDLKLSSAADSLAIFDLRPLTAPQTPRRSSGAPRWRRPPGDGAGVLVFGMERPWVIPSVLFFHSPIKSDPVPSKSK